MKENTPEDGSPPATHSRLDSLLPAHRHAAAEMAEELRQDPCWADHQYVDCRRCGFPLAISAYHISTMSVAEQCHRCGFLCSCPLESLVPSILPAHDAAPEMAEYLESQSVGQMECPECGRRAQIFLDPGRESFALLAYCPTCRWSERSAELALASP